MKTSILAAAFGLGLLVCGAAQSAETAVPTPIATTVAKPDKAAVEARSQECLKEAEVRGLHGKERRKFKEKCKRGEK
jgi:hypothetical protein